MRKFAISDIHGCFDTFQALLQQIELSKEDELYLLGDYIDRGPLSKQVFDHIQDLQTQGYTVKCLRGNHEQLMLDSTLGGQHARVWMVNGGVQTLDSFGVNHINDVPSPYMERMKQLPYFLEVDQYILVHAGLDFKDQPLENFRAMLWIRNWYHQVDRAWLGDRIVVHGHTPIPRAAIKLQLAMLGRLPVLNIDNGCYRYQDMQRGQLCAFEMTEQKLYFQPNIDRMTI
ncbi:MAG: metallophosphoesterase family protein [Bacteroidota bacterium]